METERICNSCGKPLAANAPEGLCPSCLLQAGIGSGLDIGPGTKTAAPHPAFVPPSVEELAKDFPQLEVLELIGKGGMGAVYKARQKKLNRVVALKMLPPGVGNDPAFTERFTREAQALAQLNHPGIVTLYEFGETNSRFYFLMEFVDGVNLRQLLHGGRVSAREALAIVPQICDALQYAHDHGIVHRDIKPENILLDRRGRVKVADFGLAKLVGEGLEPAVAGEPAAGSPLLTDAGKVLGTPQYMSPEQIQTPGEVDHRTDIYALGVVLYQMLTGEFPGKKIEPPSKKVQIDVRLDEVVLRALEEKPERRYQQASVLKTQIETIAAAPAADGSVPVAKPESKDAKREKGILRFGVVMAFAALLLGVIALAIFVMNVAPSRNVPSRGTGETPVSRPPAQFSPLVELPDGATLQLVALSTWPRGTNSWWSPNGHPVDAAGWEEQDIREGHVFRPPGEENNLQVVVAVSGGAPSAELLDPLFDTTPGSNGRFQLEANGRELTGWRGFRQWFPKQPTTGNMAFLVAAGPFQSEIMGRVTQFEEHSMVGELCGEKFTLGKLAKRQGNAAITLSLSMIIDPGTGMQQYRHRLRVDTVDGHEKVGHVVEGQSTYGLGSEVWQFDGISPGQVKAVHFELRPICRVEFRNVALYPNVETHVETSSGSVASGSVAEHGVSENNGAGAPRPNPDVVHVRMRQAEAELARLKSLPATVAPATDLEAAQDKLDILKAELEGNEVRVAEIRLAAAQRTLNRVSDWFQKKLVSTSDFEEAKAEVEIRQAELRAAQASQGAATTFGPVIERVDSEAGRSTVEGRVPAGAQIAFRLGEKEGWLGGCVFTQATRFTASLERTNDGAHCTVRDAAGNYLFNLAIQVCGERVMARGKFVFVARHESVSTKGPLILGEWTSESGEVLPVSIRLNSASEIPRQPPIPPPPPVR